MTLGIMLSKRGIKSYRSQIKIIVGSVTENHTIFFLRVDFMITCLSFYRLKESALLPILPEDCLISI